MSSPEAQEFQSSLCDLTVNSKPLISMLTMLAEENQQHAKQIVEVIERHIHQVTHTLNFAEYPCLCSIIV